jgi:hypothetical protein
MIRYILSILTSSAFILNGYACEQKEKKEANVEISSGSSDEIDVCSIEGCSEESEAN